VKTKVIIRADGSAKIGFGHLHRMLGLVKLIKEDFDCQFVSHESDEFVLHELNNLNIPFTRVPRQEYKSPDDRLPGEEVPFDMEAVVTGSEIVVLDGYWFGPAYQKEIRKRGASVVYIDDMGNTYYAAEVVINSGPDIDVRNYWARSLITSYYLGLPYTLVNVPATFKPLRGSFGTRSCILIAMGGSDPANFTCRVLVEQKKYLSSFDKVVVLVGKGFSYFKELTTIAAGRRNVEVARDLEKSDVYSLMAGCSFAILSASTMAIEYAQIGGFLGIIQTAKNQRFLYNGLLANRIAVRHDEMCQGIIEPEELLKNQKSHFDGQSGKRLVSILRWLETYKRIRLMKASAEHVDLTYRWASNEEVRKYAFNQNPISYAEHVSWFHKKIADKHCLYLIAFLDGRAMGSIRFEVADRTALINYLIDPAYHGMGLGRAMLAKGISALCSSGMEINTIEGYVVPQNVPSVRVFEKMAFCREGQNDRIRYYKSFDINGKNSNC
jgi:UDP-2,4-diacetamido-2,4,6-trideoxy-beta-L-altropyranose hydrolase